VKISLRARNREAGNQGGDARTPSFARPVLCRRWQPLSCPTSKRDKSVCAVKMAESCSETTAGTAGVMCCRLRYAWTVAEPDEASPSNRPGAGMSAQDVSWATHVRPAVKASSVVPTATRRLEGYLWLIASENGRSCRSPRLEMPSCTWPIRRSAGSEAKQGVARQQERAT